jgi:hypothetical protein
MATAPSIRRIHVRDSHSADSSNPWYITGYTYWRPASIGHRGDKIDVLAAVPASIAPSVSMGGGLIATSPSDASQMVSIMEYP